MFTVAFLLYSSVVYGCHEDIKLKYKSIKSCWNKRFVPFLTNSNPYLPQLCHLLAHLQLDAVSSDDQLQR